MGTKKVTCTSKLCPMVTIGIDEYGMFKVQTFRLLEGLDRDDRKDLCNILAIGLSAGINAFDKSHKCGIYTPRGKKK